MFYVNGNLSLHLYLVIYYRTFVLILGRFFILLIFLGSTNWSTCISMLVDKVIANAYMKIENLFKKNLEGRFLFIDLCGKLDIAT